MPQEETVTLEQVVEKRSDEMRENVMIKAFRSPASWNAESRSARFTMSTQAEDRYGDVVEIAGMDVDKFMQNPVCPVAHMTRDWPIGKWTDLEKNLTGRPKRLDGTLNLLPEGDYDQADIAAKMIKHGIMRACSVGFIPKAIEVIRDDEGRWLGYRFMESELVECSLVAVPANAQALVKAMGGDERDAVMAKGLIELVLDEWSRSPEGVLIPRGQFEKDYAVVKAQLAPKPAVKEDDVSKSQIVLASGRTVDVEPEPEPEIVDKALDSNESVVTADVDPVIEITQEDIDFATKSAVTVEAVRGENGAITTLNLSVDQNKAIEGALTNAVARSLKDTTEDKRPGVIARWLKSLFASEPETVERVEPTFEVPEIVTIPGSALEARAKALALRARLREKAVI